MTKPISSAHHYPEIGVPLFWPFGLAIGMEEAALDETARTMKVLGEIEKTQILREPPVWASHNRPVLELRTLTLRDFSHDDAAHPTPVLVVPPYAGHSSTIADFHRGQSLVEALMEGGCPRVLAVDWHSATPEMRYLDIDDYLAQLSVVIDALGGQVDLVGLCQGGWCAAMVAARFPGKVRRLVVAGAPLDTEAGEGAIKEAAHHLPMRFYDDLVRTGGGLMKGAYMLEGFKAMHPVKQYAEKFVELYEHADDPGYVARFEQFERWYEYTIDLPGTWYLQVIRQLFKENRFANGSFTALGRPIGLADIVCPTWLLAGARDDITPQEQVFAAEAQLGTPPGQIRKDLAEGGHIGLFMGRAVLRTNWAPIARWLCEGA